MALLKTKIYGGATANYWKVTKITSDKMNMTIRCLLTLFVDQTHADLVPAQSLKFVIPFDFSVNSTEINSNLFSLSYTRIKSVMNDIKKAAIEHQDEVPEVIADPDNNIPYSPAIPEVLAVPAVYKYPDLLGAVDA